MKIIKKLIALGFMIATFSGNSYGDCIAPAICGVNVGKVKLAWDANTESDLAGYRIYYGSKSGEYIYSIDVGNVTEYTLEINEQGDWFVAATAYDTDNNESNYSAELHFIAAYYKPMNNMLIFPVYNFAIPNIGG